MMVTITGMKKIQEPDLLLDQPRIKNNLSKPHSIGPGGRQLHKNKNNRRFPSEGSAKSCTSTTTTLTSVSSTSGCDEPVALTSYESDVVIDGLDESTRWSPQSEKTRSSSSQIPTRVWIRAKAKSSSTTSHPWKIPCCCTSLSTIQFIVLIVTVLILITSIVSLVVVLLSSSSHSKMVSTSSSSKGSGDTLHNNAISPGDSQVEKDESEVDNYNYEDSSSEHQSRESNLDLKEVSRLSWNMLNNNQERVNGKDGGSIGRSRHHHSSSHRHPQNQPIPPSFSSISGGDEVVLPSKMIFTSSDDLDEATNLSPNSNENKDNKNKKRSCCRTQKYSQVIKKDGCEPLTIPNRMCFGQCVSVWVPGLFASFPVCKPSRSSWKTVTLTCGKRKRRVRIEKVRRCSCMEIDPTSPSLTAKR